MHTLTSVKSQYTPSHTHACTHTHTMHIHAAAVATTSAKYTYTQAQKARRGDAAAAGSIAEWTFPIPRVAVHPHHELITAQLLREFTTYGRGKGAARRVDLERRQGLVTPVFASSAAVGAHQQQQHVALLPELAHSDNSTAATDHANSAIGSSSGASATALLTKHLLSAPTTSTAAATTVTSGTSNASPVAAQWQLDGLFAPISSTEQPHTVDSTTTTTAAAAAAVKHIQLGTSATTTLRELKAKAAFSLESLAAGTEEGCYGYEELRQLKTISLNKDRVGVYSRMGLRTSTSLDALAPATAASVSTTATASVSGSGSGSGAKRRPHTAVTKGSVTAMYANATRELTRCATRHSKSRALTAVLRSSGTSSNRAGSSGLSTSYTDVSVTSGFADMRDDCSSSVCTIEQQQQQQQQQQLVTCDDNDNITGGSCSRRASVGAPVYSNGSSVGSHLSDAPLAITLANTTITTPAATVVATDEQHRCASAAAADIHTTSISSNSSGNSNAVDELDAAVAQRLSSDHSAVAIIGVTSGSNVSGSVNGYVSSLSSAMLLARAKDRARRAETALNSENSSGSSSRIYSSKSASHSSITAATATGSSYTTAGAAADVLARQSSSASVASASSENLSSGVATAAAAAVLKRATTPRQLLRQVSGLAPPTATITKVAAVASETLAAERLRKAEERAEASRVSELAVVVRRVAALIVLQTEASRKREAEGRNKQQKHHANTKLSSVKPTDTSTAGTTAAAGSAAAVIAGVQSSKGVAEHGKTSSTSNSASVKPTRLKGSMRPGGLGPHYSLAGKNSIFTLCIDMSQY
jgi:trimeric autotransporter adhesin